MDTTNSVGLFGKLPAHGDFIYRNLPSNFINAWDTWLQGFVGSSQEQIGETWLDVYLTSPIWRFVFSDGVIDGNYWAGIMLPSVDRVGRYFPFSVAARLPAHANPFDVIKQIAWYEAMEQAALKALSGQLQIDDLVVELNQYKFELDPAYRPGVAVAEKQGTLIHLQSDAALAESVFPFLIDALCKEHLVSYSLWSTAYGSELVAPSLFYTRGLPQLRGVAAMLDGQWSLRGWHQPYDLKSHSTSI
jgi:type VI secretion system protein ImpM